MKASLTLIGLAGIRESPLRFNQRQGQRDRTRRLGGEKRARQDSEPIATSGSEPGCFEPATFGPEACGPDRLSHGRLLAGCSQPGHDAQAWPRISHSLAVLRAKR